MMPAEESFEVDDNNEVVINQESRNDSLKAALRSTVAQQTVTQRMQTTRVADSTSRPSGQWIEGVQSAISQNVVPRMANVIRSVRSQSPGPALSNHMRSASDTGASTSASSQISLNESLLDKEDQIAVLRSTLKVSEGANRTLENERDSYKQQVQLLQDKISSLEQQQSIDTTTKRNSNLKSAIEEMVPIKPTSEIRESWKKLSETQKQLSVALNQLHESRSNMAALEVKHKNVLKHLAELESRPPSVAPFSINTNSDSQKQLSTALDQLHDSESKVAALEVKYENVLKQLAEVESCVVASTSSRHGSEKLDSLQNEVNNLKSEKLVLLKQVENLKTNICSNEAMNADIIPTQNIMEPTLKSIKQLQLELKETLQRNEDLSKRLSISEAEKGQLREGLHHSSMQFQEEIGVLSELLENEKLQKNKLISKLESDNNTHEKTYLALGQGYREQIAELEKQLQSSNDQLTALDDNLKIERISGQFSALPEECMKLKNEIEKITLEHNKALYEYETTISQLEITHSDKVNLLETQLNDTEKRYRKEIERKRSKWADEKNSLVKTHEEHLGELDEEFQRLQESLKEYESKVSVAKEQVSEAEGQSYSLQMRCQDLEKEVSFYRSKSDYSDALQLELEKVNLLETNLRDTEKRYRIELERKQSKWADEKNSLIKANEEHVGKLEEDIQRLHESLQEYESKVSIAKVKLSEAEGQSYSLQMRCQDLETEVSFYRSKPDHSHALQLELEKVNLLETNSRDTEKRYRKEIERKQSKWADEKNSLIKTHEEHVGKREEEIQRLQELLQEYESKVSVANEQVTEAEGQSYSLQMRCLDLEKEVSFYRSKSDHSNALQLELDKIRIAANLLEEENKELRFLATRDSAQTQTAAELSKRDEMIEKLMDDLKALEKERADHIWDSIEGLLSAQVTFYSKDSLIGILENKYKNLVSELKAKLADRDISISAMVQASVTQEMTLASLKNELTLLKSAKDSDLQTSSASTVSTDALSEYSKKIQEKDTTISTFVKSSINQEYQIKLMREEIDELRSKSDSSTRSSLWVSFEQIQHESEVFAGQIIEQDEEIDDLRFQLEEHRSNSASLMSEVVILKGRLKKLESERNTTSLTEEMMSLEKINSDLRDDIRELRKRLRGAQNDIDKVAELEAELSVARRKNSKAAQTADRFLSIELDELKAFKVSSEAKLAHSLMTEEQLREDIEQLQASKALVNAKLANAELSEKCVRENYEQLQASKSLVDAKLASSELSEKRLRTEIEYLQSSTSSSTHSLELQFLAQIESLSATRVQLEDKLRESEEKELERRRSEENVKAQLLLLVQKNEELQNEIERIQSTHDINLRESQDFELKKNSALVDQLKNDIKEQDDIISALTVELKKSREIPKPNTQDIESTIRQEFEEELSSMRSQKEFFAQEVVRLQSEIQKDSNEIILELRAELQQIQESRSDHEKTMVTTYERKLSLLQMNKDLTIDSLRKDLSKYKAEAREMENSLLNKLSELEAEKMRLEERIATELQYKDSQIKHLEQNLAVHQQVSGHMKEELDQLQSGMESVSVSRRAEVEELQQDLINIQSKLKLFERENTSLKMRIEDQKGRYEEEIQKLNYQLFEVQSDSVKASTAGDSNHQRLYSEALVRMESLKGKLSFLQDENTKLREKIEALNDSRSKNDKWRNSALQEQVNTLTQRLKEIEGDSVSLDSSSTAKSVRKSSSSVLEDSFAAVDSDKYGDADSVRTGSRSSTPSKSPASMESPSPTLPPRKASKSVDSERTSEPEPTKSSSRMATPSRSADVPTSLFPPRSTLRSNSRDRPWNRGE